MGALIDGQRKALAELSDIQVAKEKARVEETYALGKLADEIKKDIAYLHSEGFTLSHGPNSRLYLKKLEGGETFATLKFEDTVYILDVSGFITRHEDALEAVKELGYALQMKKSTGSYGQIKLWD